MTSARLISTYYNVVIDQIDWSAWLTGSKVDNRWDITLGGWSNVTRDGTELIEPNWRSGVASRNAINDEEFDVLSDAAKMAADVDTRMAKLEAANMLLMEKAYAKPLFNKENNFCFKAGYDVVVDSASTFYINDFSIVE